MSDYNPIPLDLDVIYNLSKVKLLVSEDIEEFCIKISDQYLTDIECSQNIAYLEEVNKEIYKFKGKRGLFKDYPIRAQRIILVELGAIRNSEYISENLMNRVMSNIGTNYSSIKDYLKRCYKRSLEIQRAYRKELPQVKCIFCDSTCNYKKQVELHLATKKHKKNIISFVSAYTPKNCPIVLHDIIVRYVISHY